MAKKGGKKKGKKGKAVAGPEPVTTSAMEKARTRMLCPRMGDVFNIAIKVENILEDVCNKVIQKAIEREAVQLGLNSMKLSVIPDFSLTGSSLRYIIEVNLAKNNLFNSDSIFQSLSYLPSVLRINLSNNFLNGQLSPHIVGMPQLEVLNLDVNQLSSLPSVVGQMINLQVFTISDNSLTAIPVECALWAKIRYVNFRNNKITELTNSVVAGWCGNLERLLIGSNLLTSIPEDLGLSGQLGELDFSSNAIDMIPHSLAQCTTLKALHLGNNKINEIPGEVLAALVHLKDLNVQKNKIQDIPTEIGNLKQLEKCSFGSNNIKSVPDEIGELENLRELYLSNNAKLSYFPSTAGHLRRLQSLVFFKCPALKQLPDSVMDCPELRELDLRAAKKQVCKITPELVERLEGQKCHVRGGVVKKGKAAKKAAPA